MSNVEFIEESHQYLVEGILTPSVSSILKKIFPNKYEGIPQFILTNKAEHGTKLHKAIEIVERDQIFEINDLKGKLEDINYIIESSIEQYYKIKTENNIRVLEQEQIVAYKDIYAGTFDMIAEVNGELSLLDIKTTAELDKEYLSWQLSYYELAYGKKFKKLYCIWLPKKELGQLVEIKRKTKKELLEKIEETES